MTAIIEVAGLCKRYGNKQVLNDLNFSFSGGRIIGLIGPNGAGKTTALRCLLGMESFEGSIKVNGLNPTAGRGQLMRDVAFIADTAVLPAWIPVNRLLDYMSGIHPNFKRSRAEGLLSETDINAKARVGTLSKGMVTQLHLALVMATDVKLLVLDEPTLGLDILYRKTFYQNLLEQFYSEDRSIVITTHQVEEIEHLLTDVLFLKKGELILDATSDAMEQRFTELVVTDSEHIATAKTLGALYEKPVLGGINLLFETDNPAALAQYGKLQRPSLSDVFVAKMQGAAI